jgi:hypothetical protein
MCELSAMPLPHGRFNMQFWKATSVGARFEPLDALFQGFMPVVFDHPINWHEHNLDRSMNVSDV